MSVYTIADIGANHDGDYARMVVAIRAAKDAGCSAVKFQWTSDPVAMATRRHALADGYADVYRRYLAWSMHWLDALADQCRRWEIDFMCTVFLPSDVGVVAPYVARFKIASFEALDASMQKAAHWFPKPLIVSTGMLGGDEVQLVACRLRLGDTLMHCVSSYPAPVTSLNLRTIRWWSHRREEGDPQFDGCDIGFSDHSDPALTWTGALAVVAGAEIIEAHLRLDDTDPANPDYPHAMTPRQFTGYVRHIRFAEACLGTGKTGILPCEQPMAKYRVTAK